MLVGIVSALALSGVDLCPDDFSAEIFYEKTTANVEIMCKNSANTMYTDVCLAARTGAQCCSDSSGVVTSDCSAAVADKAACDALTGTNTWCDLSTAGKLTDGEILAIVLGSVVIGLVLFGIVVSDDYRKMGIGFLYVCYGVAIIIAATLLLDEHFATPYKFQTDQDVNFRLDFSGVVLTVVGAAHLVLGGIESAGSLSTRYVDNGETRLGNIISDILIAVSFALGIAVLSLSKETIGYSPETNDDCTKIDGGFYYCGSVYGVAAAGLVTSLIGNLFCIFNRVVDNN